LYVLFYCAESAVKPQSINQSINQSIVSLKCKTSTGTITKRIKYSTRELLCDVGYCEWAALLRYGSHVERFSALPPASFTIACYEFHFLIIYWWKFV